MSLKQSAMTVLIGLAWAAAAAAAPITYIYTGTGSGSIGGTPFTDAAFTITGQADTDDLASCGGSCREIDHLSTSVTIAGVGTFTITSPLRTFLNNTPGLSRQNPPGGDLYSLYNGDFVSWDLVSDWGPINTTGSLLQWGGSQPDVNTTGGVLEFADNGAVPGTFQAVLGQEAAAIPTLGEWGTILFGCLLSGAALWHLRRRERVPAGRP
jgi:hypothetical protein